MSTETVLRIQGKSEGLYADVCKIIASAQSNAHVRVSLRDLDCAISIQMGNSNNLKTVHNADGV